MARIQEQPRQAATSSNRGAAQRRTTVAELLSQWEEFRRVIPLVSLKSLLHRPHPSTPKVAVLMCTGAIYAFSVLAGPLSEAHGWTMPQVMMAFTINAAVGPIPMIVGGILTDRGWTRWLVLVGGLMFAGGFALTGAATSLTALYLSYGVLAGLG